MSPQLHPSGFRIADRPIAASFAHPYSFQPLAENMIRDDACVASSLAMGGVLDTWSRYWDESAAVEELCFEVEAPAQLVSTDNNAKPKKKKETAKGKKPTNSGVLLMVVPSSCVCRRPCSCGSI